MAKLRAPCACEVGVLLSLTALLGTLLMRLPWPTVQLTGMFMVMVCVRMCRNVKILRTFLR